MRMLVAVMMILAGAQAAFAQEEPKAAVLNDPPATVGIVKSVISKLDPSYETVFNFRDGTFSQGVSASLYNVTSNEIHIASVRIGAGTNEALYGGLGLDLPGLTRRFVPATVRGYATARPLDLLWATVGKYGRVSVVGGYAWGDDAPVYGLTAGAAVSF